MAVLTSFPSLIVVVVFLLVFLLRHELKSKKRAHPLPPGPKPFPLVGNVRDLPPAGVPEYKHWIKHKDFYGPVSSLTVMGNTIVVIHDAQIAVELMETRSAINSDRPTMTFAKMCGWDKTMGTQNYNSLLRAYRKDLHSVIGTKTSVDRYNNLQETGTRRFLLRVARAPERTTEHIRASIGAIILQLTYGYSIDQNNIDPLVNLVKNAMAEFADATVPGKWAVDLFPALRFLPEWMPGTTFHTVAKKYRRTVMENVERPFAFSKKQCADESLSPSLAADLLKNQVQDVTPETECRIKWSLSNLYRGGADTQVSALEWFFLDMLLHPHNQRLAQEEIDRVIGTDRLPTLADRAGLPYVEALYKEVMRWNTGVPSGFPHTTTQDNTITVKTAGGEEEYTIPRGSMLLPNMWWFMRDPSRYQDPDVFEPKRFLGEIPETDPTALTFGFGRRICPGRVLADATLWLMMAQTLAIFDIKRKQDGMEREVDIQVEGIPGMISHPLPFQEKMQVSVREGKNGLLEKLENEETRDLEKEPKGKKDFEILKELNLNFDNV